MLPISWLDFSSAQREQVLNALAEPKEKGTLDELGFGTVRDAIADRLFPAVSTIQTRAKYLLFVPWILNQLQESGWASDRLRDETQKRERLLIKALIEGTDRSEDGLIGRESRDTLKRMPSVIYWGSLRQLNIYCGEGSMSEYLKDVDALREAKRRRSRSLAAEERDQDGVHRAWDAALPEAEAEMFARADFELSSEQAQYLGEKFMQLPPISGQLGLIQWLAQDAPSGTFHDAETPWDLLHSYGDKLPSSLRRDIEHAWNFALCAQGCTLVYYHYLHEARGEATDACLASISDWANTLAARAVELKAWHARIGEFWSWVEETNPKLGRDRLFVSYWFSHLASQNFEITQSALMTADVLRDVTKRERALKGPLARLSNKAQLKRWEPATNSRIMNFRWATARRILTDIHLGLTSEGGARA